MLSSATSSIKMHSSEEIAMGYYFDDDTLEHHGILGQKWGVRRFQNADGSLNAAGKRRYGDSDGDAHSAKAAGHRALAKALAYDTASTAIGTNVGYKRAERKYAESNK